MALVKLKKRSRAVDYVIYIFFGAFCFITLFPIWYVLVGSFSQGMDYSGGGVVFWPRVWTPNNYIYVLYDPRLWSGLLVTVGRAVLGTATHILITFLTAYAMSCTKLKLKKAYYTVMLIPMFFGGGFIPFYVWISMLGLIDTFWVYVFPTMFSTYNMLVFLSFIRALPSELRESAVLDGANEYRICLSIILPLCKPVIATVALWKIVGHWNNYFDSMYYITTKHNLWSIQYVLKVMLAEIAVSANGVLSHEQIEKMSSAVINNAAIIITMLPMLAVYPFLQKYFAKGFMLGSLKG
jgi:putative aldouronate transport system permease protein